MSLPPFARAWLRQRDEGASAVAEIEHRELAALSAEDALHLAEALLAATPTTVADEQRRVSSGFIEQQRLFARARR